MERPFIVTLGKLDEAVDWLLYRPAVVRFRKQPCRASRVGEDTVLADESGAHT